MTSLETQVLGTLIMLASLLLNVILWMESRKTARAKERAEHAKEIAETQRQALAEERKAEAERTRNIAAERQELREENRELHKLQDGEIKRLVASLDESRRETEGWRKKAETWHTDAETWQQRYEKELINNVALQQQIDALNAKILKLETEINGAVKRFPAKRVSP